MKDLIQLNPTAEWVIKVVQRWTLFPLSSPAGCWTAPHSTQCPTRKRSHLIVSGFCQIWTDWDSSLVAFRAFNKGGDTWFHTLGWQWSPPKNSKYPNDKIYENHVCGNTGCIFLAEKWLGMCKNGLSFTILTHMLLIGILGLMYHYPDVPVVQVKRNHLFQKTCSKDHCWNWWNYI